MCNSCASLAGLVLSFIACFILLVIAPETGMPISSGADRWPKSYWKPPSRTMPVRVVQVAERSSVGLRRTTSPRVSLSSPVNRPSKQDFELESVPSPKTTNGRAASDVEAQRPVLHSSRPPIGNCKKIIVVAS